MTQVIIPNQKRNCTRRMLIKTVNTSDDVSEFKSKKNVEKFTTWSQYRKRDDEDVEALSQQKTPRDDEDEIWKLFDTFRDETSENSKIKPSNQDEDVHQVTNEKVTKQDRDNQDRKKTGRVKCNKKSNEDEISTLEAFFNDDSLSFKQFLESAGFSKNNENENGNENENEEDEEITRRQNVQAAKVNVNKDEQKDCCPFCSSKEIEMDKGFYVCQSCNAIVSKFFDSSAEWRNFNNDDSKGVDLTRCGMPVNNLLPNSSLGSVIGFSNERESHHLRLLRRYHLWGSMPYKERKLFYIFDTLTVSATSHGITKNIMDEAKTLYKRFSDMKQGRGDNRIALIASSLYMACKINNVPRSAKEIACIFNIKTTAMTKGCKKFQEVMGINTVSTSACDFIARFCSPLNLDQEFQNICRQIISRVEQLDIACDNTPPSLAVSVICFCASILNYRLDKKIVSESCKISLITINKCFHKLEMYKHDIINEALDKFIEQEKKSSHVK